MAKQNINIELLIETATSSKNLGALKTNLKDLRAAYADVEIGSKEFYKLADAVDETNSRVRLLKNGTDDVAQFAAAGQILTSTFSLATSTMAAFGVENENVEKTLLQVQAAMGIANSFMLLTEGIKKAREAGIALNLTLLANPFVIAAAAVAGLVVAFSLLSDATSTSKEELEELNKTLGLSKEALDSVYDDYKDKEISLFSVKGIEMGTLAVKKYNEELRTSLLLRELEKKGVEEINRVLRELNEFNQERIDFDKLTQKELNDDEIRNAEQKIALAKERGETATEINQKEIALEELKIKINTKYLDNIADEKDLRTLINNELDQEGDLIERKLQRTDNLNKLLLEQAKITDEEEKKSLDFFIQQEKNEIELLDRRISGSREVITNNQDEFKESVRLNNENKKSLNQIELLKLKQVNIDKELLAIANKSLKDAQAKTIEEAKQIESKEIKNLENLAKLRGEEANDIQFLTNLKEKVNKNEADNIDRLFRKKYQQNDFILNQEIGIAKERIQNNNQQIKAIDDEIELTKQSNISFEEQTKRVADLNNAKKKLSQSTIELGVTIDGLNQKLSTSKQRFQENVAEAGQYLQNINTAYSQLSRIVSDAIVQNSNERIDTYTRERDAAITLLEETREAQFITEEEYQNDKEILEKQYNRKKNIELRKQFKANQALAITQAIINGALSVTNALATIPWPLNLVFAGINAGLAAAEVGVIASQKAPQAFAKGGVYQNNGMVNGPGTGTSDSINARLSNGESVINAKSTSMFAPLLSAINEAGGGVAFAPSMPTSNGPDNVPNKTEETDKPMNITVTISEKEITEVQNKATKLRERSTIF